MWDFNLEPFSLFRQIYYNTTKCPVVIYVKSSDYKDYGEAIVIPTQ